MKTTIFNKITALLILFAAISTSCEDVVEVELNEENVDLIAVEAYINTKASDNIYVKLEEALEVDIAEQNTAINNATVIISDEEDIPNTVTLQEDGNTGIYTLPEGIMYEAIPGRTYKLTITTPNSTVITGQEYLQKVEKLDTVKVNLSDRGDYEYLGIYINSQETPGEGHYYKWDVYRNGEFLSDNEDLMYASDELVDGNYIYDMLILLDWEEEEDQLLFIGDTIVVEQLSISEAAYNFYWRMSDQAWAGSPFSVPPANVQGNLTSSDGKRVLGLFSARDISVGNTVIIGDNNYTPLVSSLQFFE